jgi:RHS repeat-associated protein
MGCVKLSYHEGEGSEEKSPLKIFCGLGEKNDSPIFCVDYSPFGLTFNSYTRSYSKANNYLLQGKERQEEIAWDDFGARMYDPALGRFNSVDPLADIAESWTTYHFVKNNPLLRIDPTGLTDFKINKETGDVEQVGDANDDPDRVLRTDKDGNVKRKGEGLFGFLVKEENRGKAKVAFGGVEKGILEDGMNLKDDSHAFAVGGDNQPSVNGVESFALKLSDYVGKEIAGSYFSLGGADNISHMTIGGFNGNTVRSSGTSGLGAMRKFINSTTEFTNGLRGKFHTHPNGAGLSDLDRLAPSPADLSTRDAQLKINPNMKFYLIAHPQYGESYPAKIDYTSGFENRNIK